MGRSTTVVGKIHNPWEDPQPLRGSTTLGRIHRPWERSTTLGKIHTPWEETYNPWEDPQLLLGRSMTLGVVHNNLGVAQSLGRLPAIGQVDNPWGISVHQPWACCRGMSRALSCTNTMQGVSVVPGVSSPSTTSPSTTSKPSLNTPRDGDFTTSLPPHPYTRPPYLRRRCVGSPRGSTHLRILLPMRFF